jgi:SAM-dependent methyltransferase
MDAAVCASGAKVLEIGCGEGQASRNTEKIYSCHVTGIDKSHTNIANANAENGRLGSSCVFICEDADDVSAGGETAFIKEYYDIVYAECVMSLSKDIKKLVGKIYDTLMPGGRFVALDICVRSRGSADLAILNRYARDAGFTKIYEEDMTAELTEWAAEKIMEYGSIDAYFQSVTPEREDVSAYCAELPYTEISNIGYAIGVYRKHGSAGV